MNNLLLLFLTLGAGTTTSTLAPQSRCRLRGDDMLGCAIGFLLVGVARLADAQLGVQPA
jgi:hypothetical protein